MIPSPGKSLSLDELLQEIRALLRSDLSAGEIDCISRMHADGAYRGDDGARRAMQWLEARMSHVAAAVCVVARLGRQLTPEEFRRLHAWFPNGVPQGMMTDIAKKFLRPQPELRLVPRRSP